jgi:hypothetical protein
MARMQCFLDTIEPLDWSDLREVTVRTQEIVRRLAGDRALLRDLLYGIDGRPSLLAMCERHQLLDKLVLYDALDRGFRVRLHISTEEHLERPHDHRFSFTALILRGSYRHVWHEPEPDTEYAADVTQLRPLFITTESIGACYTLHHDCLHTTVTTPDTVSLFIRGPAEKRRSVIMDRQSNAITWRDGERDEAPQRRRAVTMSLEDYHALRERLNVLGIC